MKINRKELKNMAKKYDLKLIILFGSRLFKKVRKDSDTDVAILLKKHLSNSQMDNLIFKLQKIFFKLDLIILNDAPPLLSVKIAKSGKVLYQQKETDFADFQIRAISEYMDYKPWLDLKDKLINLRIKKLCHQ